MLFRYPTDADRPSAGHVHDRVVTAIPLTAQRIGRPVIVVGGLAVVCRVSRSMSRLRDGRRQAGTLDLTERVVERR